jgi:hypothetical protein
VFILDQGVIIPSNGSRGIYQTSEIDRLVEPAINGFPDQGNCLLMFYFLLLDMLDKGRLGGFDLSKYGRLPLTSGDMSYSFTNEGFSEIGGCKKHGRFLRQISEKALKKIVAVCRKSESINAIRAIELLPPMKPRSSFTEEVIHRSGA